MTTGDPGTGRNGRSTAAGPPAAPGGIPTPMPKQAAVLPPLAELGIDPGRDLWVFGYGSLMWDPGFPYADRAPALLTGYHRRFCIYSHIYRGTPERPGLVLGLDHGGSCRGIAYRCGSADIPQTVAYLWEREMVSYAYRPLMLPVRLVGGDGQPDRLVVAWSFVVDHGHPQFCSDHDPLRLADRIVAGYGSRGSNRAYLTATIEHLDELGIRDEPLHALHALVERRAAERDTGGAP